MPEPVLEAIRGFLGANGVEYRETGHAPTRTSEESAAARGEPQSIGGKALLIKVRGEFRLFVLSAARKLDNRALKDHFGVQETRFATPEEILELTGLVPGSIPPFGRPILPFELYADESVLENDRIAFNAGSLTRSMVMSREDWQRLARPEFFRFSKRAPP
jgi:Ala-tRNA(Pro) deacylase